MFVIVLVLLIVGTVTPSTAITPADTRVSVVSALPISIAGTSVDVADTDIAGVPPIIPYRFVESPPNPVVVADLYGRNDGAVELPAPADTEGEVESTEFITRPVALLHQVTVCGGNG